jgi:hypothetical protein
MLATVLAQTPALPLHTAGKYVAGAYIVLFAIVLIYVAIMAIRLSHIERDLGELLSLSEQTANQTAEPATGAGVHPDGNHQDSQRESTLA